MPGNDAIVKRALAALRAISEPPGTGPREPARWTAAKATRVSQAQAAEPCSPERSEAEYLPEDDQPAADIRPCRACGSRLFWRSLYGVAICWRCHPPANDELVTDILYDGEVKWKQ
jgi:hypothetical protein